MPILNLVCYEIFLDLSFSHSVELPTLLDVLIVLIACKPCRNCSTFRLSLRPWLVSRLLANKHMHVIDDLKLISTGFLAPCKVLIRVQLCLSLVHGDAT